MTSQGQQQDREQRDQNRDDDARIDDALIIGAMHDALVSYRAILPGPVQFRPRGILARGERVTCRLPGPNFRPMRNR